MKKLIKVIGILIAIGAAVAAVLLYLKKMGFFDDCDMDCENCEEKCMEEDGFDEREYVSIQPRKEEPAEEEAAEEEAAEEEAADAPEECACEEKEEA